MTKADLIDEIGQLRSWLRDANRRNEFLCDQISLKDQRIDWHKALIASREIEIRRLNEQIEVYKGRLGELGGLQQVAFDTQFHEPLRFGSQ